MREEKFKVIQFIREFIMQIEKELDNFPKKEIEIKNRIRINAYDLLEICYEANNALDVNTKVELLEKAIAKVKVTDFLIDLSLEKKLITNKKMIKLSLRLDDIVKYLTGWIKKEKNIK